MNHLDKILIEKKISISFLKKNNSISKLEENFNNFSKRNFVEALSKKISAQNIAVIAEIKKSSPSKGVIRENFILEDIAKDYSKNGASCLSILTEEPFFNGKIEYVEQARNVVDIPILRKDFIIDDIQISETKAIGADCILLIVAALDDYQLNDFYEHSKNIDLDVLVEVHNFKELERALKISPELLGINNRNLSTFEVDIQNSIELLKEVPDEVTVISESGILNQAHLERLTEAGIYGFLIGEKFMRAESPGQDLAELISL
ncbi:MAG: indole-3-glycerol-phosphate synthase [Flavobacteriaceae bacterium]|jgi:indole-3-glycerol phosphate synthase|nr:indole-3-glycerol-phosphate synthase [Flavobacteriaceae bacterium]